VKQAADEFYQQCLDRGLEVFLDDRPLRPGVMFSDMELIGVPHRVVFSERGLGAQRFEHKGRRDSDAQELPLDELPAFLEQLVSSSCTPV
jgi:prolyl-tRNA synthetase